jgi:CheY-like chemotaxis protein
MEKTILVVDDEPVVLETVTRILNRHGYKILPAPSGPTALQICDIEPGPIDLLLTDINMPDMDGGSWPDASLIIARRFRFSS